MAKPMGSCHTSAAEESGSKGKDAGNLVIALAGNSNVGKSVVFNQLTGSNQIIGNWPGKTVQKAEGKLRFEGRDIRIVDLPGQTDIDAAKAHLQHQVAGITCAVFLEVNFWIVDAQDA